MMLDQGTIVTVLLASAVSLGLLWWLARTALRAFRVFVRSLWPH